MAKSTANKAYLNVYLLLDVNEGSNGGKHGSQLSDIHVSDGLVSDCLVRDSGYV